MRHIKFLASQICALRYLLLSAGLLTLTLLGEAHAARVSAPKLLPKDTFLYFQVANVPELVETFQQTNLGRMLVDPQIRPFFEKLYSAAREALDQVKERTGFSLDEILNIPKGEITFGAMPMEGNQFAMVFIVDCGDGATTKKLIDKLYQMSEEFGGAPQEEDTDGVRLYINRPTGPMQFVYFEHDSAVVLTSGIDTAKQLLKKWNDGAEESLADNPRFEAIMNRRKFRFFSIPWSGCGRQARKTPACSSDYECCPRSASMA